MYQATSAVFNRQHLPDAGVAPRPGRPAAYPDRCYDFGAQVLLLRTRISMTQSGLAKAVQVHWRSVQNWETGVSYPKVEALQRLIMVFLRHGAFVAGREREEITDFWALAVRNSADPFATFDNQWFDRILTEHTTHIGSSTLPATVRFDTSVSVIDWGEAPDVPRLFGREGELATLERWLVGERCRVVSIIGIGGLGKSSLAVTAAQRLLSRFDHVIFRSLRNKPAPADILDQFITVISEQTTVPLEQAVDKIAQLVQLLRERRCLLILDGIESIFQPGELKGSYRDGCTEYDLLFKSLGERQHQSCLLLTSRESIFALGPLEGDSAPIRTLSVCGLSSTASQSILESRGISGTMAHAETLTRLCGGNPLALILTAEPIRTLFGGSIANFIDSGSSVVSWIGNLVSQHVDRLSVIERVVLEELAMRNAPVLIADVLSWGCACIGSQDTLRALDSLHHRLLIERLDDRPAFVLQPLIRAFLCEERKPSGA